MPATTLKLDIGLSLFLMHEHLYLGWFNFLTVLTYTSHHVLFLLFLAPFENYWFFSNSSVHTFNHFLESRSISID